MDPIGTKHSLDLVEECWDILAVDMFEYVRMVHGVNGFICRRDPLAEVVDYDLSSQGPESFQALSVQKN